jgi:hypothetical protein
MRFCALPAPGSYSRTILAQNIVRTAAACHLTAYPLTCITVLQMREYRGMQHRRREISS